MSVPIFLIIVQALLQFGDSKSGVGDAVSGLAETPLLIGGNVVADGVLRVGGAMAATVAPHTISATAWLCRGIVRSVASALKKSRADWRCSLRFMLRFGLQFQLQQVNKLFDQG